MEKPKYIDHFEIFQLSCRSYSRPLERVATDFGALYLHGQTVEKMREQYAIRKITGTHPRSIARHEPKESGERKAKLLVAQMDGEMIPIIEVSEKEGYADLIKTGKVLPKEAKLCFARANGEISRVYGALIGTLEGEGIKLYKCAKRAGFMETTYVHGLADGTKWIVDQVEEQ